MDAPVFTMRSHGNIYLESARVHAMANGVFYERLKNQLWDQRVFHCVVEMDHELQPVFQPAFHNPCVQLQQLNFSSERYFLRAIVFQELTEQFTQSADHLVRNTRALIERRRDCIECIEEEM